MRSPEVDVHGKRLEYDPNFTGPLRRRSCTDVFCLMIFIGFLVAWGFIAAFAFKRGDVNRLFVPRDSHGHGCGFDSGFEHKPYLIFFNLTQCAQPKAPILGCPTPQVCVSQCPQRNFAYHLQKDDDLSTLRSSLICDEDVKDVTSLSRYEIDTLMKQEKCAAWYLNSSPVFHYCLYNLLGANEEMQKITSLNRNALEHLLRHLNTALSYVVLLLQNTVSFFFQQHKTTEQIGHKIVEDLAISKYFILVMSILAMIACWIYIRMLRWVATPLVWLTLILVTIAVAGLTYICLRQYLYLRKHGDEYIEETGNIFKDKASDLTHSKSAVLTALIACGLFLAVILFMLVFLRKRIKLAIAIIREGSKAIGCMTSTLIWPIFPWTLMIAIFIFSLAVIVRLASIGTAQYRVYGDTSQCLCPPILNYTHGSFCDPTEFAKCYDPGTGAVCTKAYCHYIGVIWSKQTKVLLGVSVVAFTWCMFFVSGLNVMVMSSTFATYYWTFDKRKVPFFTVTESFLRVFMYHLGTIAFGSAILTVVRIIRYFIEYVNKKVKEYPNNECVSAITCMCRCCFFCLERVLQYINRNAYIMCAIHGKNFCTSAKDAFSLLMRNVFRVVVLDFVTDFVFLMGKLLICFGVSAVSLYLLWYQKKSVYLSDLHYDWVPVVVIFITSWLVASAFFKVFVMAVDTLFFCAIEDLERNDGSAEKPYFMSVGLMKALGIKNK